VGSALSTDFRLLILLTTSEAWRHKKRGIAGDAAPLGREQSKLPHTIPSGPHSRILLVALFGGVFGVEDVFEARLNEFLGVRNGYLIGFLSWSLFFLAPEVDPAQPPFDFIVAEASF
jgi:hypothetical protein